jgi:hypothetical protein
MKKKPVQEVIMNKKVFVLLMIVMLVFLQLLNGETRSAQKSHNINRDSLADNPEDFAVFAQADGIDGVWILTGTEVNLGQFLEFNAYILGDEEKMLVALGKDLKLKFRGIATVNGNLITIDCSTFTDPLGTFTGTISPDENYMSGTWKYSDESEGGTWEATRNTLPASPDFEIRGNWVIGMEIMVSGEIVPFLWIATFYGEKNSGTFKFVDVIVGDVAKLTTPPGDYSISGNEITINYSLNDSSYVFSGEIINGNTLSGTFNHTGGIEGDYSASWAALLYALPGNMAPFGSFDTPVDGATVAGSIAVTGWALANRGIDNVKIYREQGPTLVYIGDAVFIEGARPDVEAAYPNYLFSDKAGWGYMLLTNFLPNGGNGTFVLHAIATDWVGNTTTLGTKTIYCDNEHAVKPFGAIDAPNQGGTASGSDFINWGWVLTPQPNYIPTDGSTINVIVDGVNIGHPNYNIYRADIANLFPGYANSDGAIGYFYLDTTTYDDGLHTIQWTAKDSAGNTDGIGSRYFIIDNSGGSMTRVQSTEGIFLQKKKSGKKSEINFFNLIDQRLKFKSQSARRGTAPVLASDPADIQKVTGKELGPVEIPLGSNISEVQGYQLVNNRLRRLPVGTTLDARTGKFYWSPGPGFLGKYNFVFLIKNFDGQYYKKSVEITLEPLN